MSFLPGKEGANYEFYMCKKRTEANWAVQDEETESEQQEQKKEVEQKISVKGLQLLFFFVPS